MTTPNPTASAPHGGGRRRLAAPTVAMLPRVIDSLSFLYLDVVRVHQDETGVRAEITTERRGRETVYLPTAALACVLLGPGTAANEQCFTLHTAGPQRRDPLDFDGPTLIAFEHATTSQEEAKDL